MTKRDKSPLADILANPKLKQQFKELVLERVSTIPDTMRVAIGADDLSPHDMAEHVKSEDEIGTQIMETELQYLRDVASGAIYAGE